MGWKTKRGMEWKCGGEKGSELGYLLSTFCSIPSPSSFSPLFRDKKEQLSQVGGWKQALLADRLPEAAFSVGLMDGPGLQAELGQNAI